MHPSPAVAAAFRGRFEECLRAGYSLSTHDQMDALDLFESGASMTAEQIELAAKQRAAMLNFARSYRRRGVHVTVDENSTQQELADFTTRAISAVVAADRRIRLTRKGLERASEDRRADRHSTAPPNVTRSRRPRRSTRSRVSASDDGPGEPSPAICAGCTVALPPGRSDRAYHSTACKQRAYRLRQRTLIALAHEPLVVDEIRSRRLTPEDGLLWMVAPDAMRAASSFRTEGDRRAA
jgi:hypothetical protein